MKNPVIKSKLIEPESDELPPTFGLLKLLVLSAGIMGITFAAAFALFGGSEHAFWYLSRASAFAAFGLLWLSMVFGLLITNKLSRVWPGGPTAFDLHQFVSLLGLGFMLFHALILLGDHYSNYTLLQLAVPFASANYEPLWVGVGQVSFYLLVLVSLTFYVRGIITPRVWRLIHFLSFGLFVSALAHGILSGSDTGTWWASAMYWIASISTGLLTAYRIFGRRMVNVAATERKPSPMLNLNSVAANRFPRQSFSKEQST